MLFSEIIAPSTGSCTDVKHTARPGLFLTGWRKPELSIQTQRPKVVLKIYVGRDYD